MTKLFLLAAVIIAVFFVLRGYSRSIGRWPNSDPEGRDSHKRSEDMVRCDYCSLHLPLSEAVQVQGKHFCSKEHARIRRH